MMWKKFTVILVATFGFALSVLALDNNLFAADSSVYTAGGSVTGRVNIAPIGVSGSNIGMQKGDKVLIGTNNPKNNVPLGFQLIQYHEGFTDYTAPFVKNMDENGLLNNKVPYEVADANSDIPLNGWYTLSSDSITVPMQYVDTFTNTSLNYPVYVFTGSGIYRYFTENTINLYVKNQEFFNEFKSIISDSKIIQERDLTSIREHLNYWYNKHYQSMRSKTAVSVTNQDAFKRYGMFIPLLYEDEGIPVKDLAFKENYWKGYISSVHNTNVENATEIAKTPTVFNGFYANSSGSEVLTNNFSDKNAFRPGLYLDLNQSVFAISLGSNTSVAKITENKLSSSYTSIYEETKNQKDMKVRIKDSSMTITFANIQNSIADETTITKTSSNSSLYLRANANAGSSSDGVNTVSALIFQHNDVTGNDDFKYYKPLESAKGDALYEFDTTGLPIGKYKIAIVNEVYNEASTAPADSSLISDVKELEIVNPISNLTFKATSNLKYNSNVNVSDTIGTISSSNGAGTPVYTLVADPSHADDVTKFGIDSDGKTIKVKDSALDAGTYYFKIQAQDGNGDPATPLEISAQITVGKALPTVAFDNTARTVKTIAQAQTEWNETATSAPSNSDLLVTYDISGGNIGVITIDPNTGSITPTSSAAKGKVTIRATVDDNSTTGKDNYESASTTKEVIIIEGVDGTVTPDSASSDSIIPTFKATDPNVKTGGKIAKVTGVQGFFDNTTSGAITYSYALKSGEESSYFLMNSSSGLLTSNVDLVVGTYQVTVIVSDKWSSKEIPITINVGQAAAEVLKFYKPTDKTTAITSQSAKLGASGVTVFAEVKGSTNTNAVSYEIKLGSPSNIVTVHPTSGAITTLNTGTTIITATKKGISGQADAITELTFTVTAADQTFIFTDVSGNELSKNEDGSYQPYKENGKEKEYAKAGTFQLYTSGSPTGATITYTLKSGSPTDVISVDENGLVTILNANTNLQKDKVIVTATSVDPTGNFADKTIEIPINIIKANTTISFNGVTNVANGDGSVEPVIVDKDLSSNAGGVIVNDTQYILSVDPTFDSSIAWTNDGKTINYSYSEAEGIEVPLKVTKPGNRNYNSAEATGKMNIVGQDESILEVSTPGKITYGDNFVIRSLQDDSSSTNVNYIFTLNDRTYVKDNTQTGNQMSFDAIQASGTNEIEIKVERTANGEMTLSKTVKVKVLPKDITIQLDSKTRKVGENNPAFTYQDFSNKLVSWSGVKDVIQPSDMKITSTATPTSPVGNYPVTLDIDYLNTTYPNYKFKVNNSTLTVSEDSIGADWYHMEKNDTTSYTANTWVNQDVLVKPDHSDYTKLSLNKLIWEDELTISTEGKTNLTFYMKSASNAISGSKSEVILIDKTKPKINSIKGTTTKPSALESFLNAVTFNTFFKPGDSVEIQAEDAKPSGVTDVSGISTIQYKLYEKVSMNLLEDKTGTSTGSLTFPIADPGIYKVCAIATDNAGNQSDEMCEEIEIKKIDVDVDNDGEDDFKDPDNDGCPDINIKWKNKDDSWTKLNIDRNDDGVPDVNVDSDGDGEAELNIDTDDDGKPDLNLIILTKADWKPTICVVDQPEKYCTGTSVKALINVDTGEDGIPDIDIDTNGDFKPDFNITKDGKTPSINIGILHDWIPEKDGKKDNFTFDTMEISKDKILINIDTDNDGSPDINIDLNRDGKPEINVDTDGDFIPNINVDTDGDGKADVNVDTNKDGKADENIIDIKEWKPEKDCEFDGFKYDTMSELSGKDQLEDQDVVVTKPGGVFLPNFALKVDRVTDTVNEIVKNDIIRKSNGQIIEEIFDVKLLKDNVQVQPDGKLQIKLPLPNNLKDPHLVIEQEDGTYLKVKPEIKDGYMYYESDFLGKVSIVKDAEDTPTPDPEDPAPDTGGSIKEETKSPSTSVKGTYYSGANTGDSTMVADICLGFLLSGTILCIFWKKYYKDTI